MLVQEDSNFKSKLTTVVDNELTRLFKKLISVIEIKHLLNYKISIDLIDDLIWCCFALAYVENRSTLDEKMSDELKILKDAFEKYLLVKPTARARIQTGDQIQHANQQKRRKVFKECKNKADRLVIDMIKLTNMAGSTLNVKGTSANPIFKLFENCRKESLTLSRGFRPNMLKYPNKVAKYRVLWIIAVIAMIRSSDPATFEELNSNMGFNKDDEAMLNLLDINYLYKRFRMRHDAIAVLEAFFYSLQHFKLEKITMQVIKTATVIKDSAVTFELNGEVLK